jgi:hypothetical protein
MLPFRRDRNDDGPMGAPERKAIEAIEQEHVEAHPRVPQSGFGTHDGSNPDDLLTAHTRRTQAVSLALAGMSWDKVAEIARYTSAAAAQRAVQRALDYVEAPKVADLRNLENARLDRQLAAIWTNVVAGDLKAGRLALLISERRAKLNGLDKATEPAVTPGAQEIADWVSGVLAATRASDASLVEANVIDAEVIEDDADH